MFKSNLRTALLGSGAAIAMMAVAVPASADEMSELKAQIDALQGKLGSLEARQQATEKKTKVAPAAAIEAGDKPKSLKWAGTNTSVSFSGYAKLDFIYDIGQSLGDSAGVAGATVNTAASNIQNNFRAHARQTRIRFQSWTPTDWGELATHIEGDFEGAGGNQAVSNSNGLRLRHAFGRLGPVLAGQTWSTFMDISSWPETVDFNGPSGGLFVRQAQLRYTHSFGNGFRLQVAAENSEGFGRTISGGAGIFNGNLDPIPDFAGNLRYSFDSGYLMAKAVVGLNRLDNGAGASDTELGWGISGSGVINLGPNDSVGFEVSWLDGMNRYMLFGTANRNVICSAACATGVDSLSSNQSLGGFVWYRHRWTDTMRSTVSYSGSVHHAKFGPGAAALNNGHQIHANLVWSPVSQVNIGFEVQYWTVDIDTAGSGVPGNSNVDGVRLQLGMQYNF